MDGGQWPARMLSVGYSFAPYYNDFVFLLQTAAFKLKRKQVTDFYATEIREMFELANSSGTKSKTACKIAAAVRNGTSPPPVDQGISVS